MSSTKRSRTLSSSPSSLSSSLSSSPTPKASRTLPVDESVGVVHSLLCTLPPTCNHKPTPIANSRDLEAHYATYHAHVCEEPGCRCVFPDARLLELHLTECHDPLAAVRRERGEKIFACFLSTCPKRFLTPKARRLHLIQAHTYPKEYFFAVTNKGVGGLLKKWGEGASMIRKEWKSRENDQENLTNKTKSTLTEGDETQSDTENTTSDDVAVSGEDVLEAEAKTEGGEAERERTEDGEENGLVYTGASHTRQIGGRRGRDKGHSYHPRQDNQPNTEDAMAVDSLTDSMSSLSLVPSHIRFGRGGTRGFTQPREQSHTHGQASPSSAIARGRGLGRGGGVHGLVNANGSNYHASSNNTHNDGAGMDVDASFSSTAPARAVPRGRGNFRGRPGIIPIRGMGVFGHAGPGYRGRARGRGVGPPPGGFTGRGRGVGA